MSSIKTKAKELLLMISVFLCPIITFADEVVEVAKRCNGIFTPEAINIIKEVLLYFSILAPGVLILLIAIDFAKAVGSNNQDEVKKATGTSAKRIIATICLFLVPTLVRIMLGLPGISTYLQETGIVKDPLCIGENKTGTVGFKTDYNLSPSTATNKSVTIKISTDYKNVSYIELPNKTKVQGKSATYKVDENGNYTFKFYTSDGKFVASKTVSVSNIDKEGPYGTASILIKNGTSRVTVKAHDKNQIKYYEYMADGIKSGKETDSIYIFDKAIKEATINVYDEFGNMGTIKTINVTNEDMTIDGKLEVHFMMVGDGDAIMIRSKKSVVVIDGGYAGAKANKVIEYMKSAGVTKIDTYIASHYDGDHIGATPQIFAAFPVTRAYIPAPKLASKGGNSNLDPLRNKATQLKKGDRLTFDGEMIMEIMGPPQLTSRCKNGSYCTNSDSLNIMLRYGETNFFFAADYVWSDNILKSYSAESLKADVLKQPHHGLHDYISKKLLATMKPEIIIVTDGRDHLSDKMKSWHKQIGAKVYHTCAKAIQNVAVVSDGTEITLYKNTKGSQFAIK